MSETIQFPFEFDEKDLNKAPLQSPELQVEEIVSQVQARSGSDIDSYYGVDELGKSPSISSRRSGGSRGGGQAGAVGRVQSARRL